MHRRFLATLVLIPLVVPLRAAGPVPTAEQIQFFEAKVRPLLLSRCAACHGEKKQSNGLRVDSHASLRTGGDTGPAFVPGKPDESLLIKAVRREGPKMPPKETLKPEEVAVLVEWVKQGAPWPAETVRATMIDWEAGKNHWAFQPVRNPAAPAVKHPAWPQNEIDRFILARIEAEGLRPVGPAEKRILLRRATYDLIGLPPTPEEIDAFLADDSPQAFAKVVERLLASPHYGERWGRHWLDLVRYADSAGDNSDYPIPQMFKYRNWVIRAFNDDKPYDQFLREQVAGDLLASTGEAARRELVIATGYLANSRRFGSVPENYPWHLTIEDTIDNLGRTVLGLTVNCARCHDHKFDPISTQDYYGLYGFFENTRYPWPGIELDKVQRDLGPLVPPAEAEAVLKERKIKTDGLDAEAKRSDEDRQRAEKLLKDLPSAPVPRRGILAAAAKQRIDDLKKLTEAKKKEKERLEKQPLPFETAYAVAEGVKQVGDTRVHVRGDPGKLGPKVSRRFPTVLGGQSLPLFTWGSGRANLAEWLTDPKNPLTARVMVNRIWQHHFGKPIVPTPSDFGKQGKPPTHSELLDYLAAYFMEHGWSIKQMHRLMMLSATYQQASSSPLSPSGGEGSGVRGVLDPENRLLAHFPRRRLDAEAIRDTILMLSGTLDRSVGGPHPFPDQTKWDFTQHKPFKEVYDTPKRSVYLMTQRIQRHPFLALFDGPDTNASTALRITSTTPLQALFLMNDSFVHEQAKRFAARLLEDERTNDERRGLPPPSERDTAHTAHTAGINPAARRAQEEHRIDRLYLLAYARPPSAEEKGLALEFLEKVHEKLMIVPPEQRAHRAWESLVRAVWMSNEFVYVN